MFYIIPILSRYGAIIVQFIVIALVTQSLPIQEVGVYFTLFGLVTTTSYFAGLGIPEGVVKKAPQLIVNNKKKAANKLVSAALKISVLSVSIPLALCLVAFNFFNIDLELVLLGALWWFNYTLTYTCGQLTTALGRPQVGSFIFYSLVNSFLLLILVPYLLLFSDHEMLGVLKVTVIASGLAALVSLCILILEIRSSWKEIFSFSIQSFKPDHLKSAWQIGLFIAGGRVVQSAIIWTPVWVASIAIDAEHSAKLALATRLAVAVGAVIAAIRFSVRPKLSAMIELNEWSQIETMSRKIAFFTSALAIFAIIASMAVGNYFITLIFGQEYDIGLLLSIVLLAILGESIGGPVDEILKMDKQSNIVLYSQITFGLIGGAVEFLFAHKWGLYGLAMSFSLVFSSYYLFIIWYLRKIRNVTILPNFGALDGIVEKLRS